jgi:hypothetical protein
MVMMTNEPGQIRAGGWEAQEQVFPRKSWK